MSLTTSIGPILGWILPNTAVGAVLRAAALLAIYAVVSRAGRRVLLRAVIVALPVALLGFAAFRGIVGFADPAANADVMRALIAGSALAAGWIVTFAIQELRNEQQRLSRQVEMLIALRAEALDYLQDVGRDDIASEAEETAAKIERGDGQTPFQPFIPTAKRLAVFAALSGDLPLLRQDCLAPIVAFFTQVEDVHAMSQDMQREDYRSLPADRRARMYRHFAQMRKEAEELGFDAVAAINRQLWPFNVALPPERPDA